MDTIEEVRQGAILVAWLWIATTVLMIALCQWYRGRAHRAERRAIEARAALWALQAQQTWQFQPSRPRSIK